MTTELTIDQRNKCSELAAFITKGIEAWVTAGEILVELLDTGVDIAEVAEDSGIPKHILYEFEKIGRRTVHPQLVASSGAGYRALRRCGYAEQQKYLNAPVEVLVIHEDGATDTLQVKVENLTSDQARQVFGSGNVRDLAGQRAYIQSEIEQAAEKELSACIVDSPYRVSRGKVTFRRGAILDRKQLARVMEELA